MTNLRYLLSVVLPANMLELTTCECCITLTLFSCNACIFRLEVMGFIHLYGLPSASLYSFFFWHKKIKMMINAVCFMCF